MYRKIWEKLSYAVALWFLLSSAAFAQSATSPNAVWNSGWAPRSASQQQVDINAAQVELQAENGGLVSFSQQNYNGAITNNYTYTGAVSNSSSSNTGAVNSVSNTLTGVTGSTVSLTVLPSTSVAGATQSSGSSSTQSTPH